MLERADEFRTTDDEALYCREARESAKRRTSPASHEVASGEGYSGTLRGTPEGDDLTRKFHEAGLRALDTQEK